MLLFLESFCCLPLRAIKEINVKAKYGRAKNIDFAGK